jgi:hypothetical protein
MRSSVLLWQRELDLSVETTRPEKSRVENVDSVGSSDDLISAEEDDEGEITEGSKRR